MGCRWLPRPGPTIPPSGHGAMFVAPTVRSEYRVTTASRVLRFVCVSDLDEYTASPCRTRRARSCTTSSRLARWTENPAAAFEFVECTVDGRSSPRDAHRDADRHGPSRRPGTELQLRPTISFTYRVLVQQRGHLLHLDLSDRPKASGPVHASICSTTACRCCASPLTRPGGTAAREHAKN